MLIHSITSHKNNELLKYYTIYILVKYKYNQLYYLSSNNVYRVMNFVSETLINTIENILYFIAKLHHFYPFTF